MVLFGGNKDSAVVVGMGDLLDLVRFHEQFAIVLSVLGEDDVEGLVVSDVEQLSIVGEVDAYDVLAVFLDNLGWFEVGHDFWV